MVNNNRICIYIQLNMELGIFAEMEDSFLLHKCCGFYASSSQFNIFYFILFLNQKIKFY